MGTHVEYDLGKADKERNLKTLQMVDYNGDHMAFLPWERRFTAFKIVKWGQDFYRFLYVFERVVYYQRTDIIDLDTEHGEPFKFKALNQQKRDGKG